MATCDLTFPVLHRLRLLLGVSLASSVVAACGDNLEPPSPADDSGDDGGSACVSTEVDEFPAGVLGRPEQVTLKDFECPAGGLANFDLNGRWSLVGPGPFDLEMPLIHESCEDGFEIELDRENVLAHRDGTNLFIRSTFANEFYSLVVATRICAGTGSDELTGVSGTCFRGADQKELQCFFGPVRMTRFGRPSGEGEADGLELVSEFSGGETPWPVSTTSNVKVLNGVAFVSRLHYRGDDESELRLVDVSNPETPRDLGAIAGEENSFDFNDVKLFQVDGATHAVLAGGLCPVVDASDPARPTVVSSLGEPAHSIFVREDNQGRPLAYLATVGSTQDLPIYDLSDPANPVVVERVPLPSSERQPGAVAIHDLFAEEDRLYLNASFDGFYVMERTDGEWMVAGRMPTNGYSHASWVGDSDGRRIAIVGDEGYDAHLRVVDIDPASKQFMTEIGSYQTRPEVSIHNMMLLDGRAYFTYYHDGVRILDLADPTSPELVAYYHTWDVESGPPGAFEGAIGLDVDPAAGLIYVADISRGLLILRETR